MMNERLEKRTFNFKNPQAGKILIVGDRPGPGTNPNATDVVPFNYHANCSGWLNNQLIIDEDELSWLNAYDIKGQETSIAELNLRLPAKCIIALGNNASKWLAKYKIHHIKTYHPQYWKRFKHNEPYPLIQIINSLVDQLRNL